MNTHVLGSRAFNQDISAWNTAKVTTMEYMFYEAAAFNQNISAWNTAAVTTMERCSQKPQPSTKTSLLGTRRR